VPGKVKDIYFNNVRVRLLANSHIIDKRPCKGEGFVKVDWSELKKMAVPLYTENATVDVK
jgi:hypothetical protein